MTICFLRTRQFLPPILAWVLLLMTSLAPALDARAAAAPAQPAALKSQLLEIPIGSPIEVRLMSKEKIRGQLAAVADDGVTVRAMSGAKIEETKVAFDQVRSVKQVGKGIPFVAKVFIGIGITAGVLAALVGIACATGGCTY